MKIHQEDTSYDEKSGGLEAVKNINFMGYFVEWDHGEMSYAEDIFLHYWCDVKNYILLVF